MERRRRLTGAQRRHAPRHELDFDDVVYGIHAVSEALTAGERLRVVHVAADRKRDAPLRELLERAEEAKIRVRFESRAFFASLPVRAHQGVVAIAPPFSYASLNAVMNRRPRAARKLFVLLDHLTDPHN
ncbi:MAG: hypothetical protein JOZ01_07325, partial [Candidatus Eremiobacteraeota bacterium]|nr:hypothetical protein [Candidatus Eremiobacteraeota bacterium]